MYAAVSAACVCEHLTRDKSSLQGSSDQVVKLNCGYSLVHARNDLLSDSSGIDVLGIESITQARDASRDLVELDAFFAPIYTTLLAYCRILWCKKSGDVCCSVGTSSKKLCGLQDDAGGVWTYSSRAYRACRRTSRLCMGDLSFMVTIRWWLGLSQEMLLRKKIVQ